LSVRNVIKNANGIHSAHRSRYCSPEISSQRGVGKKLRRIFEINTMHCTVKVPTRTPGKIEVAIPGHEEEFSSRWSPKIKMQEMICVFDTLWYCRECQQGGNEDTKRLKVKPEIQ
jgi:hypothetical protein